jgi:hypothetical protein
VTLQVVGPAEVILLSIWGAQLESMGKSSSVDSLLRYKRDNPIGISRNPPYRFIDWPNDPYAITFIESESPKCMDIPTNY